MSQWLIIGISGVTCGGKSCLATSLYNYFEKNKDLRILSTSVVIGDTFHLNQDDYFLPVQDSRHKWVESLNHINWEILTALDLDKMLADARSILKDDFIYYDKSLSDDSNSDSLTTFHRVNILILEGFILFNHPKLLQLCQIKFHLHIPYEKCYERRKLRVYDPPDVTGYFEMIVWPMYEKHFWQFRDREDIIMLNGELSKDRIFNYALGCVNNIF